MPDRTMKISLIVLSLCVATPAFAQEPVGCDKFKWPLDKERATLIGSDLPKISSGNRVNWPIPFATARAPKSNESFAGFIQSPAPAKAATYKITLSSEGWIDVVQDGRRVQ